MWIFIILAIFIVGIFFEAFWSKNAYTSGPSNHAMLVLWIVTWFLFGFVCTKAVFSTLQYIIIVLIYGLLRFSMFDYILNNIRGHDFDYTGTENSLYKRFLDFLGEFAKWLRLLSLIGAIVLTVLSNRGYF